jgi:L,D-transpeptidase YcbB
MKTFWGSVLVVPAMLLTWCEPALAAGLQGDRVSPCAGIVQASDAPIEAVKHDLCALIEAARLADLRWRNFRDYRSQIRDFYQPSNYALAWTAGNQPTAQARAMIQALQNAGLKGLRPEDYDGSRWQERIARLAQATPAGYAQDAFRFDLALTVSAMRYLSDLHSGRINPRQLEYGLKVNRRKFKLADYLRSQVVNAPDVNSALEQAEPSFAGYRRTKAALEHYLALASEGEGSPLVVSRKSVKPGDSYAGLSQLAERLRRLGDLPQGAVMPAGAAIYEGALVEAVKHFQQRHGLQADGSIGRETFRELTTPLSRRVAQLQLALERWRWLPQDMQPPMIVVNVAGFHLQAYDDLQHPSLSMNVIVGIADDDHQTPIFADRMAYLIFRPYWKVPDSIIQKEIIPNIQKDPAYLAKHEYEMVNKEGEVIISDTMDSDIQQKLQNGDLDVRQKPGTANALGLVKFVFPNSYDVYLHGTPEQQLFARSRRTFSHGCVRVEDPVALAAWVLHDPAWTTERIKAAMNGKKDSYQVNLPKPIPVLILYATAEVSENGEVSFFDDIYKQDTDLEHALAKGYPYPN